MKSLMLAIVGLVVVTSAQAKTVVTFECTELNKKKNETNYLFLSSTVAPLQKNGDIEEGKNFEFDATMYFGNASKPYLKTIFNVSREDVMVKLKNKNNSRTKVKGIIFLDEPEDSWLTMNGKNYQFTCEQKVIESKR